MTNKQWFKKWDETYLKFKWFFLEYGFASSWDELLLCRDKEHRGRMTTIMNNVWFKLPDNKFNIRENPAGWNEFLYLLEND